MTRGWLGGRKAWKTAQLTLDFIPSTLVSQRLTLSRRMTPRFTFSESTAGL